MLTPLSPLPFLGFTVTLVGIAVSEADPAPFSNTKEIVFLNLSPTDTVLIQIVDVSAGLPLPGSMTEANSVVLPPGAARTMCIGPEGERQPLATQAFWVASPGANLNVVFRALAGVPDVDLNITYIQSRGGGGG
jgi:hypothetical protein